MTSKNLLPLVVLIAPFYFSSCGSKKDPSPSNGITAAVGKIDVKAGTVAFDAMGEAQITGNQIILGGAANSQSLSIIIGKSATTGTYTVKGTGLGTVPDAEVNFVDAQSSDYSSLFAVAGTTVGTVTITEIDQTNKTISGTFNSQVLLDDQTTTLSLTGGSFNKIPYVTSAASSLTAKINGTAFTSSIALGETQDGYLALNGQTLNGGQIIVMSMASNIAAGSYAIGALGDPVTATYTVTSSGSFDIYGSTTGTLTITKNDTTLKRIEGTFSFNTEDELGSNAGPVITAGTFGITYN